MFIGHFGVALAAKNVAPKTSLGTLFIACQLADLLWPLFLLLGWEWASIDPGNTAVAPLNFEHYPISHSLATSICWALVMFLLYRLIRRDTKSALIVGAVTLSHWVLDWFTHRPDLPLYPGSSSFAGLGLWNSFWGTILVEGGIFIAGVVVYLQSTRPKNRTGTFAFWGLIAFLVVMHTANLFGPPPPSMTMVAYAGNAMWLIVLWGYWMDKNRMRNEE